MGSIFIAIVSFFFEDNSEYIHQVFLGIATKFYFLYGFLMILWGTEVINVKIYKKVPPDEKK